MVILEEAEISCAKTRHERLIMSVHSQYGFDQDGEKYMGLSLESNDDLMFSLGACLRFSA